MYTTSRYSSVGTRELAMGMARESGEPYVARGKKTIDSLIALARRAGETRVMVVVESGGAPSRIQVIAVDEMGGWAWEEERLLNSTAESRAVAGRLRR